MSFQPGTEAETRTPDIAYNQRYAGVGKTRSGKTTFAIVLASVLVEWKKYAKPSDPEVWFVNTKNDPRDLQLLFDWGYRLAPEGRSNYRIFTVQRTEGKRQWENAQNIFAKAYSYGGVLLVVDEYRQVTPNTVDPGPDLLDVFQRGGGLGIGIIGLTQEPVYIPRQLVSQATHQFIFDLSYPNDIKRIREFYEPYRRPLFRGDKHGMYHLAVDYDGLGAYYHHYKDWVQSNNLMERIAA